ncbi:hypothetical protein [Enterococcus caccae]|uniref:Uncharacterized protein n=1 Tax=Enterococcus caccae ATCC BAA-1240 TaxID=1158612 RepID=R3W9N4_9ENTE|nr:hypothetical protein [Enterococcus caccae]EOL44167.1 hypothetical protein UC7_02211 [Enterococcus caccae ATCC BAA-1240]EOT68717.1 hypothetical protein I580_01100 [Enterococcus caccae ATCC BAA-1240]OJG28066.1 hypothetical protein RU98_GL001314 [Enterococcus caccae]
MEQKLIKITTTFHNTWLIDVKEDDFSKENNILFGDTLRLSISKSDSYYFAEAIALTHEREILTKEKPSNSEFEFFQHMKKVQEQNYSKGLAEKYHIEGYVLSTIATDNLKTND